jgi:hypothetical protein
MRAGKYQVAYPAHLQVARLNPSEKAALSALFRCEAADQKSSQTQKTQSGEFISRLGSRRRVLWRETQSGPEVLSVIDGSYAG